MRIRSIFLALCAVALAAHAGAQAAGPWTDLGGGLAGAAGIPTLAGTGDLSPGTPGNLKVIGAAPTAPCLFYFSLLAVDVPFKGGTLSAFPPISTFLFVTNPTGGLLLPWSSWTGSLPAGLELYFQVAVKDSGAIKGVSISNLVLGITQP
jgi:hypothetical protein